MNKIIYSLYFAVLVLMASSCQKEQITPNSDANSIKSESVTSDNSQQVQENDVDSNGALFKKGNNKGKGNDNGNGKGKNKKDTDTFSDYFRISLADDDDPLYEFSISESGTKIILESDPNKDSWGTDFYGYWSDPFNFYNNTVSYLIGTETIIYSFSKISTNKYNVNKTLIKRPVLGGVASDTIYSHPGVYTLVN